MVITNDVHLPSEAELTVDEIALSTPVLRAAAFHLGKYCENQNNEFMLCRNELKNPVKCINEGKDVTACSMDFFQLLKKHCRDEFTQYATCLEKSSGDYSFGHCRKTQAVYDACVLEKLKLERPGYGYFCRARIHDSPRPPPAKKPMVVYEDAPYHLPADAEKPPAKYGSRFYWLNE